MVIGGRKTIAKTLSLALVASMVTSAATMLPVMAGTSVDAGPQAMTDPGAPAATHGDLSHLVFTARTGLFARAVSPDDGGVVNSVAASFEVATIAGAGVEVAVNAKVVPAEKLGRRAELEDGSLRYTYYGVVLAPGSNTVVLTPLGADGLRGPSVTEHVWGPGPPATMRATACAAPRADGRTACAVSVSVLDEWGHPAAPGATLKLAVTDGDAVISQSGVTGGEVVTDLTLSAAAAAAEKRSITVVLGPGSTAGMAVVPGTIPGRIHIGAGIGAVSTSVALDAMAFAREPFVTGLATVGIGAVPGELGADPSIADGTNSRRGRVALYGTGTLSGNAVGSLAYDTAGALAATPSTGTFNDDPNDRPYATYGDASIRRNDALTQDKLYARVDDGHTSAMWGQFEASTGPAGDAGAIAMQVDGAKMAIGSATMAVSAFTAANQIGYGRQILTATGLATINPLAHDNLIVGSETVTLVSLDRLTGVVLHQTTLQNVVDYTIDYIGGMIHFVDVPLPYDVAFNPQQILVTYEYSAIDGGARTTGGRFDAPLGRFDNIKVGLGYLNDVTGSSDFALLGENATGLLPGGLWSFSHAGSNGFVPSAGAAATSGASGGSALRFNGSSASGPFKLNFGYDATSGGFSNPFGDLNTPGLTDYHGTLLTALGGRHGDFSVSYDHERNLTLVAGGGSLTESNLAATLRETITARFAVRAGLTVHGSETTAGSAVATASPSPVTRAAGSASVEQADLGLDWKALKNVALSIDRSQTVGGSDPTLPAQTTAKATWDLNGRGRIYIQELLSDTPARSFGAVAGIGSATRALEFGIEQRVDANTSVDSEYAVSGTGNGTDVNAAIGVKERLVLSRVLKGDAFVQRGVGSGSSSATSSSAKSTGTASTTADFTVYGLSLGYGDVAERVKATGSFQDRTGFNPGATWSLGFAGKLGGDYSLLAADEGSRSPGSSTTDARAALAWRPSLSDRGAMFVGYERAAGNADVAGAQSGVLSLDGVYRPNRRLQVTGRYARKTDGDSNYAVGTSLVGLGVRQQLGPRYDVGIETREVLSASAGGGLHSTAGEFGAMIGATLRAAVGYNFGATADPTLAAAPTRKGIYTTLTTTIDRIFGWGAH